LPVTRSCVGRASWGSQEGNQATDPAGVTAKLFPGFREMKIATSGAVINVLTGGSGPPLLVMHGYPQTHVEWHRMAREFAQRFTVVLADLRLVVHPLRYFEITSRWLHLPKQ
jgi:pimeloyl-ACP methyl ester carboxylesterase